MNPMNDLPHLVTCDDQAQQYTIHLPCHIAKRVGKYAKECQHYYRCVNRNMGYITERQKTGFTKSVIGLRKRDGFKTFGNSIDLKYFVRYSTQLCITATSILIIRLKNFFKQSENGS